MEYPKLKDPNFQRKINQKFGNYRIKEIKSMRDYCYPKKRSLQIPQKFLGKYINPSTPYKGILIYHKIGAGKTASAVTIAEHWKKKKRILVLLPASLVGNFYNEIRKFGDGYIKKDEKQDLQYFKPSDPEYKNIIKKSNQRIDQYYDIMSYNQFVNKNQNRRMSLKNYLVIIDEIQNMVSEDGSYYKILERAIAKSPPSTRIVLMSATPIFDKPVELALTMNLLKLPIPFPTGQEFNETFLKSNTVNGVVKYEAHNLHLLKSLVKGYVSYYRGAPPVTFPKQKLCYVKCRMSSYQYNCYKTVKSKEKTKKGNNILSLPNDFFIGTRMISNIAFPNKLTKEKGLSSMTKQQMKIENLERYSIKFFRLLQKVRRAQGTVFIYSNFKAYGGIGAMVKIFEANGYLDYKRYGEGKKRFAIWSGDQNLNYKEEIKNTFNQKCNADGSCLKVLFGTPAIKEGISLLRVQQVHVMEPYWNWSRMDQIIGRAIRYCSHKDMPASKRLVKIYIYLAVHPNDNMMIDQYILNLAMEKKKLMNQFEQALKEAAVDCSLNKKGNVFTKSQDYPCSI